MRLQCAHCGHHIALCASIGVKSKMIINVNARNVICDNSNARNVICDCFQVKNNACNGIPVIYLLAQSKQGLSCIHQCKHCNWFKNIIVRNVIINAHIDSVSKSP
jgi:hypothetical protein